MENNNNDKKRVLNKERLFTQLHYHPHHKQAIIHQNPCRFRTVICGRRFGKSKLAAYEAIYALLRKPDQRGWIVAPTYELADKVFREVWYTIYKHFPFLVKKGSESNKHIKLINGSELTGKSADNVVSLIGEGLHFLIIDEAAQIKENTWKEALRPTLADFEGWALFITTPKGRNWVFEEYSRGQDTSMTDWASWRYGTIENPYISPKEIEQARQTLPESIFKQEWLGEFIDSAGSVFRKINECVKGTLCAPVKGAMYVGAVDLAKHQDFTVILIADARSKQVVYFDRFNEIDWTLQKTRIKNVSKKYNNARMIVDSRGVGDSVFDDLRANDVLVEPFNMKSNQVKFELINNLSVAIDNQDIYFPDIPELLNELRLFQYVQTPSGNVVYSAPEGYHDDIVVGLAMLNRALQKRTISWLVR